MSHEPSGRSSPPVGLRVVRPYRDEEELIVAESSAFTRSGVVLIGAPSRPVGVVLRFEIALADGTSVMRGEGRVVEYRAASRTDDGALAVRFTRLDLRSKELLDRAIARREQQGRRVHSVAPPAWSEEPPPVSAGSPRRSTMPPSIVDRMSMSPSAFPDARASQVPPPGALGAPKMPRISVPPPLPTPPTKAPTMPPISAVSVPAPVSQPFASTPIEIIVDEDDPAEEIAEVDDSDLAAADDRDRTQQLPAADVLERVAREVAARPTATKASGDHLARLRARSGKTAGLSREAREAALARLRARGAAA